LESILDTTGKGQLNFEEFLAGIRVDLNFFKSNFKGIPNNRR
jgi:hypothetical protein